jgi:hypothetical protein
MHRKATFVLAAIFLAVALVVPPVLLIMQSDKDADNYSAVQNPNGMQTGGNITLTPEELQENHANTFILVIVIEVVFALLFTVTLYLGINHIHPKH